MARFIEEHDGGKFKPPYYKQEYTYEQIAELALCANDPIYFIRNHVQIIHPVRGTIPFDLFDFQERLIENYDTHGRVICMLPRQCGKTQASGAYILHQACFIEDQTILIAANKGSSAKEIMERIRDMYMELPWYLKPGILVNNVFEIKFDNGSRILAETTTKDTGRGKSCVTGDTKVVLKNNNDEIYYTTIDEALLPQPKRKKPYYCVYEVKNKINEKVYIGFHKTHNLNDNYMGSGKAIIKAIEKYGIENFERRYIEIFDNIEDALKLEAEIVNEEFVQKDTNYNICIGGQVRIMPGKNNPFYGKKHSPEVIKKIIQTHTGNNYCSEKLFLDGKEYASFQKAFDTGISRIQLFEKIASKEDKDTYIVDITKQKEIEKIVHKRRKKIIENTKIRKEMTSKRFKGVLKSDEHKEKISLAHKGTTKNWVADKINRNPEKIKKTIEKHKGSKRSDETKLKMSIAKKGKTSNTKGTKWYHNPKTKQEKMIKIDSEVPEGFILGKLKNKKHHNSGKRYYHNPNTKEHKMFSSDEIIPEGFILGMNKQWKS